MADKDFVVKNGLVVNTNLLVANGDSNRVGINNTTPDASLTVTGTANVSGNVTLGSNLTIIGTATASQVLAGSNVVINTTSVFVGNSTVNTTHTSAILQVSNSTSTANLTAVDLKIGTTTVNSSQVAAGLLAGNVSGSYANISGQVNTGTIFVSTSANIASAVQANSTGVWTTGTVNAVTFTTGSGFNGAAAGLSLNTTAVGVSTNTTVNAVLTPSSLQISNSTSTANLTPLGMRAGNTTVNTTQVSVGANLIVNSSAIFVGNSTVNTNYNQTQLQIANSTSTANLNALELKIGSATVNSAQFTLGTSAIVNTSALFLGNSTVNLVANSLSLVLSNSTVTTTVNATNFSGTANNTSFVGSTSAANVVSNSQLQSNLTNYQTTAGLSANVATLTSNNATNFAGQPQSYYTNATNITSGTLAAARISGAYTGITGVGTLSNVVVSGNASVASIASITTNATVNAFTVTNNTNVNFNGGLLFVDPSTGRVGVNTASPAHTLTVVGTANVSANLYVGGDLVIVGNTVTTGTQQSNGDFNPTSNGYSLGNTTNRWSIVAIDGQYSNALSVSNTFTVGNSTVGIVANSTLITFGNSTVNVTINTTAFSGTANNATNFAGQPQSYYTNATNITSGTLAAARLPTGNATTIGGLQIIDTVSNSSTTIAATVNSVKIAYDAAIAANTRAASAQSAATSAYTNATTLAANADNLTSGTVAAARLPSGNSTVRGAVIVVDSVVNTSVADFAAAPNSVKVTYDVAIAANTRAASAQSAATSAYTNAVTLAANATNLTSGTVAAARLPSGNSTVRGALIVLDSVTNTSIADYAASANSVKLAYDVAILANTRAASAQSAATSAFTNATTFAANADNISSGTVTAARLPFGNATTRGALIVLDSVTNTSITDYAPSANSVKTAYDAAIAANTRAASAQSAATSAFSNATTFAANASNLGNGTVPSARLSGGYTSITQVGTLTGLAVTGNSSFDSGVLFVDGTNNRVGVNTTSPSVTLQIAANDAVTVPTGNTTQRPTGANGMFRYNTDTGSFEGFANGAWGNIAGGSTGGGYYKGNLGAVGNTDNKGNLYRVNSNTQSNNITIAAGENALTVGPMIIQSGVNLTIEEGGRAVII